MTPLVVFGLRTLACLEAKEDFYKQIDRGSILAEGRFPEEQLEIIADGFGLGILSSHSVGRIESIINHLGWSHLFPKDHLISSAPKDRKDVLNWRTWLQTFHERGLKIHTVIDIGEVLVRNLASSSAFEQLDKYYVSDDPAVRIEGATRITSLEQTVAYRLAIQGKLQR